MDKRRLKNIILVGPQFAGKTEVAQYLQEQYGYRYLIGNEIYNATINTIGDLIRKGTIQSKDMCDVKFYRTAGECALKNYIYQAFKTATFQKQPACIALRELPSDFDFDKDYDRLETRIIFVGYDNIKPSKKAEEMKSEPENKKKYKNLSKNDLEDILKRGKLSSEELKTFAGENGYTYIDNSSGNSYSIKKEINRIIQDDSMTRPSESDAKYYQF